MKKRIIAVSGGKAREVWQTRTFEKAPREKYVPLNMPLFDVPIASIDECLETHQPKIPLGRQIALLKSIRERVSDAEERVALQDAIDSLYNRSELYWKAYKRGYRDAVRKVRES